jgi:hypothetical protein
MKKETLLFALSAIALGACSRTENGDVVVKRPVAVETTTDTLHPPTITTKTDTVNTPVVGTKKTTVRVPVVKKP